MAIQIRRGASEDFDASKMVAGELGVATDGSHKMWATGQAGDSWELANKEDLDDEVEARETLAETVEAQGESLETKAEVDGMYDELYAGGLTTDKKQTDKTPYLLRKTASELGSDRIGERCYETIIGASVGENQLSDNSRASATVNGITFTNNGDGSITANGTSTSSATFNSIEHANVTAKVNHVYYIGGCAKGGSQGSYFIQDPFDNGRKDYGDGAIYKKVNENTRILTQIYIQNNTTLTNVVFRPQLIDLTALLGSSIADYIYSLETATAGSGITKLREWGFLKGYQAHNAGSIESVEVTEKKVVGFNQYDKDTMTVNGEYIIDSTGEAAVGSNYKRTDYIPVIGGKTYYVKTEQTNGGWGAWYDADKNYISGCVGYYSTPLQTAPANARYIRLTIATSSDGSADTFCFSLSSDRNGEYEAYVEQTYDYGTDILNGIFKLDASNNLYADGDVKSADGTITRKYGIRAYQNGDESLADAFTNGIQTVYKLTTPTTEQSAPFPSPQVCYPDGTEEYVTSNGVPVGHETEYPYDLKGLVEGLIDVPDVPSTNGTYVLKATRSADGITYTWVADSAVSLASPLMSASPQTTTDESDESEDSTEEEGETTR